MFKIKDTQGREWEVEIVHTVRRNFISVLNVSRMGYPETKQRCRFDRGKLIFLDPLPLSEEDLESPRFTASEMLCLAREVYDQAT